MQLNKKKLSASVNSPEIAGEESFFFFQNKCKQVNKMANFVDLNVVASQSMCTTAHIKVYCLNWFVDSLNCQQEWESGEKKTHKKTIHINF